MSIALTTVKPPEGSDFVIDHMLGYGIVFLLDFTGNYVTGGEVITAPNSIKQKFKILGAGNLYLVQINPTLGYTFEYDYTNDKVKVRQSLTVNPDAELAAAAYPAGILGLAGVNRVRGIAFGR